MDIRVLGFMLVSLIPCLFIASYSCLYDAFIILLVYGYVFTITRCSFFSNLLTLLSSSFSLLLKIDAFMSKYYANTSFLWAYEVLNPVIGTAKVELWRLAVLYLRGGK